jgi:pimeloyl-ACP methyl ester carboxylesterase
VVEYVTEATGNFTKLIYVGHSMGTTIGFLYAGLKKNHAEQYMKGYIALCPVTAMRHSAFQTIGPAVDIILVSPLIC